MAELLAWMEDSPLGAAVRGAGVWAYALLNLAHILGIATLFGSILALDLRLLGIWRKLPLHAVARPAVPLAGSGFALAVVAGICMIATNGRQYVGNPFLYVKFPAIALGIANVVALSRLRPWRERNRREPTSQERMQLAIAGGVSLASWLVAICAGRMIGYW